MNDRIPGTTWSNPVWHRGWRIFHDHNHFHDYSFVHDDFHGGEHSKDDRFGTAPTIAEAKAGVDAWFARNAATHEQRGEYISEGTAG